MLRVHEVRICLFPTFRLVTPLLRMKDPNRENANGLRHSRCYHLHSPLHLKLFPHCVRVSNFVENLQTIFKHLRFRIGPQKDYVKNLKRIKLRIGRDLDSKNLNHSYFSRFVTEKEKSLKQMGCIISGVNPKITMN